MTDIKLEIGKKYNNHYKDGSIAGGSPYEILWLSEDENVAFIKDCAGIYDIIHDLKNGHNLTEYKEPDIFEGIEEGDVVEVVDLEKTEKGATKKWYGIVTQTGKDKVWFAFNNIGFNNVCITKDKIKSITKLVPEGGQDD